MGIKAILLIVAIIFLIIAIVVTANPTDYLALGLIFVAAALLVEELNLEGLGRGSGSQNRPVT